MIGTFAGAKMPRISALFSRACIADIHGMDTRNATSHGSAATHAAPDHADFAVASILRDLEQAAEGEHVAWCLSSVCDAVLRHSRTSRIDALSADTLKVALKIAETAAKCSFPHTYPLTALRSGVSALVDVIDLWASSDVATCVDLRALARIFQNDMHNLSLREEIELRGRSADWSRVADTGWMH